MKNTFRFFIITMIYYCITLLMVYLISLCFGIEYTIRFATGIFLCFLLVAILFSKRK